MFIKTIKQRKKKGEVETGSNRRSHEASLALRFPLLLPRKTLRTPTQGLGEPSQNTLTLGHVLSLYTLAEIDSVKGTEERERVAAA